MEAGVHRAVGAGGLTAGGHEAGGEVDLGEGEHKAGGAGGDEAGGLGAEGSRVRWRLSPSLMWAIFTSC